MKKFNNSEKSAYTLPEIITAIGILAVVIGLTISNLKKQLPDIDKTGVKKSYNVIENTVHTLINDTDMYPDNQGFMNLAPVTTEFGEIFGAQNGNTKFRDAFKYTVDPLKDNLKYDLYGSSTEAPCFQTDDKIVYCIPDSNFVEENTIQETIKRNITRKNTSNRDVTKEETFYANYVPITVYPNLRNKSNVTKENDAFVVGVRYNGSIKVMPQQNCDEKSKAIQCLANEFLNSSSLRNTRK